MEQPFVDVTTVWETYTHCVHEGLCFGNTPKLERCRNLFALNYEFLQDHGRRKGRQGALGPVDFENFSKNRFFSWF